MSPHESLRRLCKPAHWERLTALNNRPLTDFIAKYAAVCKPASVFVRTDAPEDAQYIRGQALRGGEEEVLRIKGHTIHFDGYADLARDVKNTRFLVTPEMQLGRGLNTIEREEGLQEMHGLLDNAMAGREMYVLFFCLGPVNSDFSIYAVQLTDSCYVAHSEDILYRPAYRVFAERGSSIEFFKYVHSAGEVDERKTSIHMDRKRIYVDFMENIVYSINTQYAGNTVGLKKLSLRLAIRKADREQWLAEHMFVMNVNGPAGRKSYFLGAFPSMCGKTSTCMVAGENIVGDDIAYLRTTGGAIRAVNVERGIFGIIENVNSKDDPLIWKALTNPGEVIFSNVLVAEGTPYWSGDGRDVPARGCNASGDWQPGKKDAEGSPIAHSHPNARYTLGLHALENCDPVLEDPTGVPVQGIIYGGRDSDTCPPVLQSFSWSHGVVTLGACLESETTAATLGQAGVRKFNIMANLDFLSIPIGKYIENHLRFAAVISQPPAIFGVNYFLKDRQGNFLTDKQAKRVWLKWMELRSHGDVPAVRTPIGLIPRCADLQRIFTEVLGQTYSEAEYREQFSLRADANLAKVERMLKLYRETPDVPAIVIEELTAQQQRIANAQKEFGDFIDPAQFP